MKQVPLYSAVAAAVLMSTMTTANAQENSSLDIGRLALAGYGDVTYISQPDMKDEAGNDIQNNVVARFVPIFLFQMSEKIHIEAELEFATTSEGETETVLEYANMHYFFNDNTISVSWNMTTVFGTYTLNRTANNITVIIDIIMLSIIIIVIINIIFNKYHFYGNLIHHVIIIIKCVIVSYSL